MTNNDELFFLKIKQIMISYSKIKLKKKSVFYAK